MIAKVVARGAKQLAGMEAAREKERGDMADELTVAQRQIQDGTFAGSLHATDTFAQAASHEIGTLRRRLKRVAREAADTA